MKLTLTTVGAGLAVLLAPLTTVANADQIDSVLRQLNESRSVKGTAESKSYTVLFDAYLQLDSPPFEVGRTFSHNTIHAGMRDWSVVSSWAESNPDMGKAILACEEKTLFGLPYGASSVDSKYREARLMANIGADGSLRDNRFPYLRAIDTIAVFATAESYRLLEAGQYQEGLDLMVASLFVMRQCCDREFLAEQLHTIPLFNQMLSNLRDIFYVYRSDLTPDQCAEVARGALPFLSPDRSRLFMPEGDRVVSEALISEVFDSRGQPDREKFGSTFAEVQSRNAPLTRFGAARRWRIIADVHASWDASEERLTLVYDDWWRRWRIQEYDPILDIESDFERTNPVRYAAVIYSMQNIEELFDVRNESIAALNGTIMAGGICGYLRRFETYPSDADAVYATFVRKRSDKDPFDTEFKVFKYRVLDERFAIDTPAGRIWLEKGKAILYSKGKDHDDDRGREHSDDGIAGDIVMWPPIKALLRENDLIE